MNGTVCAAAPHRLPFRCAAGGHTSLGSIPFSDAMLQALAHALDYLKPFGLDAVLRCGAAFRPFSARSELALSPNALAQLEVLRNHDDGGPRGCALPRQ